MPPKYFQAVSSRKNLFPFLIMCHDFRSNRNQLTVFNRIIHHITKQLSNSVSLKYQWLNSSKKRIIPNYTLDSEGIVGYNSV